MSIADNLRFRSDFGGKNNRISVYAENGSTYILYTQSDVLRLNQKKVTRLQFRPRLRAKPDPS